MRGLTLLVPLDTREVRFGDVTNPSWHPIPASDSCVVVDIKKLVEAKEATS